MVAAVLIFFAGIFSYSKIHLEAFPNTTPVIIEITAQAPGLASEQIEKYYTIPIETALFPIANVTNIRSTSFYGLSWLQLTFSPSADYYSAYAQAAIALEQMPPLNNNVTPIIQQSSPLGEVLHYQVTGPDTLSLTDLRTLQDWVIGRRLKTVAGVVQVNSWGGTTKQFSIDVDQMKLEAHRVTIVEIVKALENANINVGGREISIGQQSINIRGIGMIDDGGATDPTKGYKVEDIENVVLNVSNGVPTLIKNVAKVSVGHVPRLGIVGKDFEDDVVTAVVVIGRMQHSRDVVPKILSEIELMNTDGSLPPGVKVTPFYNRTNLANDIQKSIFFNLLFGMVLVFMVQWFFIGDYRSAIIVCVNIPISFAMAIIIFFVRGEETNLLSISVIDFGIIIDSSVILVENIFRTYQSSREKRQELLQKLSEGFWGEDPSSPMRSEGVTKRWTEGISLIYASTLQVNNIIIYTTLITLIAFVPIFFMTGIEGFIFEPMARGYCYALIGAFLATLIVTPVLSSIALPKNADEIQTRFVPWLRRLYAPLLRWAMTHRKKTIGFGLSFIVFSCLLSANIGVDFIPALEEKNFLIKVTLPPTLSLQAGVEPVHKIREILMRHPEVETVVSHLGRPDNGSETQAFFNAQFFVLLKPFNRWRSVVAKDLLRKNIEQEFANEMPGAIFSISQYIEESVDAATFGVSSENAIKLYGKDIKILESLARKINKEINTVPGIADVEVMHSIGQQNLNITINREKAARYGLNAGEINEYLQDAIGGVVATNVFEAEKQFGVNVRLSSEDRKTIEEIGDIKIGFKTHDTGAYSFVPLRELATINLETGASFIYREMGRRHISIRFSVWGRDLDSTIKEVKRKLAKEIKTPEGYEISWVGDSVNLINSSREFGFVIFVTLTLMFVILFGLFNSARDSLIALSGIPFVTGGGVIALYITGNDFSISAGMGFISLFGLAVMDGIFNILHIRELRMQGLKVSDAVFYAAEHRVRPMLITAISAAAGLMPAAISQDIGSHIQRPLAIVVVGGVLFGTFMLLIVPPVIRSIFLDDDQPIKTALNS